MFLETTSDERIVESQTRAEVIAIGDELTSGQRLDTNSQWLSQRLGELGIRVLYHTTVADDLAANVQVLRQALERAEIVVCTGGLGPTADDLTREALAQATGTRLLLREDALQHIRNLFARRGRVMPEQNQVQAMFPEGSRMIDNPHGTAPGIDISITRGGRTASRLFALPGVPAEMHEMWASTVQPAIGRMLGIGRRVIRHRQIKCFGVGESDLEGMLPDLIRRGRQPTVGITVSKATITLRITAEGESEQACEDLIAPTVETIRSCLGDLIFGEQEDELQHVAVRLLRLAGKTLSTVEWGPGGLLAHWLSDADPANEVFVGGTVVRRQAGLAPPDLQRPLGELVAAMAKQGRAQFGTDYCLAVSEFPASVSGEDQVFFALATPSEIITSSAPFRGHPDILKARSTKHALDLLRLHLIRASVGGSLRAPLDSTSKRQTAAENHKSG